MYQLGIDTGGTFTDFVVYDEETGRMDTFKNFSTPDDPSRSVISGVERVLNEYTITSSNIRRIVYGTTVATNALLESKGSLTGLITTHGFRDILEIRRQWRPKLFDLYYVKPEPLVPRNHRVEVGERINANGEIIQSIDMDAIRKEIKRLVDDGVKAIAVSFLFSFLNPIHEKAVEVLIQKEFSQIYVTTSYEICPEFREYERTATTTLNAYLMPITSSYLKRLRGRLEKKGIQVPLRIMQSNGGLMMAQDLERAPVNSLLSGPVGGVVGAVKLSTSLGFNHIITLDMGGTSTDICLVQDGNMELISESEINYNPVKVPQVNIHTIGAGGGSIASLFGGLLKVGPHSAGADPGPVCYARGGMNPTTTDAALQLCYIDPQYFLGGKMVLDFDTSRKVLEEKIAKPMKISVEEAADAILLIQAVNIENGIRVVSLERGHDVREFVLVGFGGATGLLVGRIADRLSIPKVVIPSSSAVFSAIGLMMSDIRRTRSRTKIMSFKDPDLKDLNSLYFELDAEVKKALANEGGAEGEIFTYWSSDIRYLGQAYEVNVPFPDDTGLINSGTIRKLQSRFHGAHLKKFGHSAENEPVEFVCHRVLGILPVKGIVLPHIKASSEPAIKGHRRIYFGKEFGMFDCPIFERERMGVGEELVGPAIIEDSITTTVVYPSQKAEVDPMGNIIMTTKC